MKKSFKLFIGITATILLLMFCIVIFIGFNVVRGYYNMGYDPFKSETDTFSMEGKEDAIKDFFNYMGYFGEVHHIRLLKGDKHYNDLDPSKLDDSDYDHVYINKDPFTYKNDENNLYCVFYFEQNAANGLDGKLKVKWQNNFYLISDEDVDGKNYDPRKYIKDFGFNCNYELLNSKDYDYIEFSDVGELSKPDLINNFCIGDILYNLDPYMYYLAINDYMKTKNLTKKKTLESCEIIDKWK